MSAQGGGGKSRWGSLLSQAVAGVEARLDTILAEEDQPKPTSSPTPSQQSKPSPGTPLLTKKKPPDVAVT